MQGRDVGVLYLGRESGFVAEAFHRLLRAREVGAHHLDGDRLFEFAIRSDRQEDRPHTAFAEAPFDEISANPFGIWRRAARRRRLEIWQEGLCTMVRIQERLDFRAQLRIAFAGLGEERASVGFSKLEHGAEDPADPLPTFRRHRADLIGF